MDPKQRILKDQLNGLYCSTLNQSPSVISEISFLCPDLQKEQLILGWSFSSCFEDSPEPKSGIRIFQFDDL